MENYNTTGPYLDIVSQVSGHACSETKLPLLVLDSANPNLMNLKPPLLQTTQYEGTLLKCSKYYQLSSNGNVQEGSLDAALTNGMDASYNYIHMANLSGPYAEYITPVNGDVSSIPRGNHADGWNGGCSDKLSEIRFLDTFQLQAPGYYNNMFICDCNRNRGGFNFHPALVQNLSEMLPGNDKVKKETNPENMVTEKNTISKVMAAGTSGIWDVNLPLYRETTPSSFTALQNMRMSQLCMTALDSCGGEFIDCPVAEKESAIRVSCDVLSKANSGDSQTHLHENTADLDALLSSDEEESSTGQESSTGHSPSEYSANNKKACTQVRGDTSDETLAKKTGGNQQGYKENEADCRLAIIEESVGESSINDNCCFFNNSLLVTSPQELGIRTENCEKENERDNKNICALSAVSMLTEAEGSTKNSALRCRQSHKSLSGKSASAKKAKKERIKGMVQLLRTIISGEDYMDTAIVLNKTIRYVKSLEVKVNILEANQQEKANWV